MSIIIFLIVDYCCVRIANLYFSVSNAGVSFCCNFDSVKHFLSFLARWVVLKEHDGGQANGIINSESAGDLLRYPFSMNVCYCTKSDIPQDRDARRAFRNVDSPVSPNRLDIR